ncbi:DNA-binding NarL/FixJ family response regulator [Paenibacillus castaneae]|uniref:LuxR C-terminal-related transcriptional regulator n=1 Tax=Paenibacillus castaneae TaxID=474957 RepID=UPI000C9A7ECA|nr:response regulator transcription factor [Paenibacillus castaneae]NIK78278.1 DNA-binding NarL/FixJ family response regulator [Paenibacillus castaneae]
MEDDGQGSEEERLLGGLDKLGAQLEQAGGNLQILSFLNQGITVTYTLPIADNSVHKPIKVVVTDSEPIVREALMALLSMQEDMEAIADPSGGVLLPELCERMQPDIILLATNHGELDYISLISRIKQISPTIKLMVMTSSDHDRQLAMEAIHLGAEGYIEKAIPSRELLSKIRLLYRGEMIITQQLAKQLVQTIMRQQDKTNEYGLTDRELEVLQCLSEKMKYKEIAEKLFLAEGTVRNYLSVIYSKLEVTSRSQATEKAQTEGII